jgi:hypothetical protein
MLESLRLAQSKVLSEYFQNKGVDSENPGSFYQEVRDVKRSLERMRDEVRDHISGVVARRLHDCGNIEGASILMPLLVESTVQQLNKPSFVQSSNQNRPARIGLMQCLMLRGKS